MLFGKYINSSLLLEIPLMCTLQPLLCSRCFTSLHSPSRTPALHTVGIEHRLEFSGRMLPHHLGRMLGPHKQALVHQCSFCSNNDGWQLRHSSPVLCQSLQANDVPDFQPETWGRYYRIASNILKSICLGQRLLTYNLLESIFPAVSAGRSMLLCLYKIIGCVLVLCQCQQPVPSLCISSLLSVCQKVSVLMLTAGFLAQVAQLLMCFLCRHLPHSAAVQAGWKHLFLCLCDSV